MARVTNNVLGTMPQPKPSQIPGVAGLLGQPAPEASQAPAGGMPVLTTLSSGPSLKPRPTVGAPEAAQAPTGGMPVLQPSPQTGVAPLAPPPVLTAIPEASKAPDSAIQPVLGSAPIGAPETATPAMATMANAVAPREVDTPDPDVAKRAALEKRFAGAAPITPPVTPPAPMTPPPVTPPNPGVPIDGPSPLPPAQPVNDQPSGGPITEFGPGNDLIPTQINPVQTDRERAAAADADRARGSLASAPDRAALALDYFKNFDAAQGDERRRGIQDIGRSAAKFGRIGSGAVTTDLGNLEDRLNIQRERTLRELSADAAGQTLSDNLNRFGALSGEESRQFGQNAAARGELRGERGYQYGLSRDAIDDQFRSRSLADQLLNSDTNRRIGLSGANRSLASDYAAQSQNNQDAITALLEQLARERARNPRVPNVPEAVPNFNLPPVNP